MRVIVTGSREWDDEGAVWSALDTAVLDDPGYTIVQGGCPSGADAHARAWAQSRWRPGASLMTYRADRRSHGGGAGPIRNQQMVDAGADLVLAFPRGASAGTRGCIYMAKAAGLRVIVEEAP
ncbi:MAG: DUF2493 domain-containing protein [Dermatophilaceae bacterium]